VGESARAKKIEFNLPNLKENEHFKVTYEFYYRHLKAAVIPVCDNFNTFAE